MFFQRVFFVTSSRVSTVKEIPSADVMAQSPHHCAVLALSDRLTNPAQLVSFTATIRSVGSVSAVTKCSR
ncbi:hypothetical protein J6590_066916 [Homalodisca vitripennis]|nr:hypothetical protein J6590_066916 [Homalodisca vitripennis]